MLCILPANGRSWKSETSNRTENVRDLSPCFSTTGPMRSPTLRRPSSVFNGRHVVQRAVRADRVVLSSPQVYFDPRFFHGSEPLAVQTFVTELAIQALHKRVLSRFAGLDEAQCDPGFLAPEEHCLAGEFGAVVADNLSGRASFLAHPGQEAYNLV